MHYRTNLIYFILLMLSMNPLWAQDTRYRVEVLVLTHLNHSEEAAESKEISDYSSAIDFLTPAVETEETAGDISQEANLEALEEQEPDPNAVVQMEEMSDVMREAWRRLRLSAPFRPQQYLSWEQGNQEPFPALRIHDLDVIMTKDPYARERLKQLEADLLESESEQLKQAQLVSAESIAPSQPAEPEAALEADDSGLPGPSLYYRLDGEVSLSRSRFLHLHLNIQMREGIWEPEPLELVAQNPAIFERAGPTTFLLQELRQSRQVKTERMEYFDGPVVSVLAFITSVKVNSEQGE
jgi:hypothetical protein